MKKNILVLCAFFCLTSCSIQQMVYNAIAPEPVQKYKQASKPKKQDAGNPIFAFTGETDVKLVSDAFPVLLKSIEMLYHNNPHHKGISIMLGQLYVMYANAFVERPAKHMSNDIYEEKYAALMRAKSFYLRGSDYALKAIEQEYPGFLQGIFSEDEDLALATAQTLKAHNIEAVYYGASGILASFALSPMDVDLIEKVTGARLMLERACELDPTYDSGAIWEVLTSFYGAAPDYLGGGLDKAEEAWQKAFECSGGKKASTYVTYANLCVPTQDGEGFDEALRKALAIDPDDEPETRLMTILSQQDALWMQEHREEFIY